MDIYGHCCMMHCCDTKLSEGVEHFIEEELDEKVTMNKFIKV